MKTHTTFPNLENFKGVFEVIPRLIKQTITDTATQHYAHHAQKQHIVNILFIPALIFWRYFRARVDDYLLSMEVAADRFARHLLTLRKA